MFNKMRQKYERISRRTGTRAPGIGSRECVGTQNEVHDGNDMIRERGGGTTDCAEKINLPDERGEGGRRGKAGFGIRTSDLCNWRFLCWRFLCCVGHRGAAVSHKKCKAGPNNRELQPKFHQDLRHESTYISGDIAVCLCECLEFFITFFRFMLKFQTAPSVYLLFFLGIPRNVGS